MLTAADVMTKDVATIRGSATVKDAIDLMKVRDWKALIVERRHEQDAYGVITESDIVYKVIAYGKDPQKIRVYEIMTKPCIAINPNLGLEYVARLFANWKLRCAPVIRGELLGIISLTDILAHSSSGEKPRSVILEEELEREVEKARQICQEKGPRSRECAAAWDAVEEMQAEISHQRAMKPATTAFEEYCNEFPEALEARVYDT
ncbi:MAG: CBS domain-containing protein [Sphaerospermopsis sp. SIO1G2]|nr:CBS domain-containing protein [Sphaerospermopsis sp. SIO1G1]NET72762.1 CBS domain-containing protein [Sphaerospermopsis sp. SIO1G2]